MIRNVALWLALALAQPALAQTAPTVAPKPSPAKPSPAKPATKKPEPPKPDAAAQSGPCGIGVIPHIGENFALQSIGITMFGNELKKVPIESWGLDDLLVARVRAAAGPHFAVRRIAYPANAFATFDDPPPFHNGENDLKEIAQTVSRAGGCERYIVAVRDAIRIGDSNIIVSGIGVFHRGGLIDRFNTDILVVLTALDVIDGHTFEILKKGYGWHRRRGYARRSFAAQLFLRDPDTRAKSRARGFRVAAGAGCGDGPARTDASLARRESRRGVAQVAGAVTVTASNPGYGREVHYRWAARNQRARASSRDLTPELQLMMRQLPPVLPRVHASRALLRGGGAVRIAPRYRPSAGAVRRSAAPSRSACGIGRAASFDERWLQSLWHALTLRIVITPPRRGIPTALWVNIAKVSARAALTSAIVKATAAIATYSQSLCKVMFALPVDSRRKEYTKPKPTQLARAIRPLPTARGQAP